VLVRELWVIAEHATEASGTLVPWGVQSMPRLCDLGTLAEWIERSGPMRLRTILGPMHIIPYSRRCDLRTCELDRGGLGGQGGAHTAAD
jgi:hypothetical protein